MEPTARDPRTPEHAADQDGRTGEDLAADQRARDEAHVADHHDPHVYDDTHARERFGGANFGAGFFGWLVAVGLTALLTGLLAAAATAVNYSQDITQSDAEREAGTITLVTAIVLLAVLLIGYYAGGYVAGRMSRFDGGRQGLLVWVIGLVFTVIAIVLGWLAGDQYNVLDRVDLPRIPIPTDQLTLGGVITAVAVLLGTLLAAMAGGKVGRRYHDRVDRAL
jgi:hypothetical protein